MPELPEVETVRAGLQSLLVGHRIIRSTSDEPKVFPNDPETVSRFLHGATVVAVRRRAKVLIIDLSSEYSLVIHLKMTGQLVYVGAQRFGAGHPSDSLIGRLPDRSTRVALMLDRDAVLYFNDMRKFGWMRLMPSAEVPMIDFMKRVGPEPLEPEFTPEVFAARISRRARSGIKAVLLDQTIVAGIGNIYADESLWMAQIHPMTAVQQLTDIEIKNLHRAIVQVLSLSIEKGGSTDKNYVNAEGKKGSYMDFANVFRREGLPCPRHAHQSILKLRVAGRGTHICPECQRITRSH